MNLIDSHIAVIGGAGFIGSHLVELLLEQGVGKVTVYDNFTRGTRSNLVSALEDPRVNVYEAGGDIRDKDILQKALNGVDGVFHLAALWLLHCVEFPRSAFHVNIEGTFNVLEACIENDVKKLVYSSSASVYGNAVETPMTEGHPFKNETFYGASKIAGEQMVRAFHHKYGLDFLGLRYMNVYGSRQDYKGAYIAVIMRILDRLKQDLPPILYGDGSQTYDFIHVKDIAKANICAMKSDHTNDFLNVGSGIGTSLNNLTALLLDLTNSKQKIEYKPTEESYVSQRIGCPIAARESIDFEYSIELVDGLRELIDWHGLQY